VLRFGKRHAIEEGVGRKSKISEGESTMSIQKKSLINTLKSAKKANVVKEEVTVSNPTVSPAKHTARMVSTRRAPRIVASRKSARRAPRSVR
jgi:hypothetical protein